MKLIPLASCAALMVMATTATAAPTVSFAGGSGTTAPNTTVFQNFDSYTPGMSIGSNAFAYDSSVSGGAARPAYGSSGNYAAVLGGGSYTVNFAPTSLFSFVLGSLDTYNSLTLAFSDNSTLTYVGGQIINNLSFPSGDQINGETNGVVTYNTNDGPQIVGATFQSSQNSFEFDNLARGGVPEPATWALVILGFGAIGGVMRHKRRAIAVA